MMGSSGRIRFRSCLEDHSIGAAHMCVYLLHFVLLSLTSYLFLCVRQPLRYGKNLDYICILGCGYIYMGYTGLKLVPW